MAKEAFGQLDVPHLQAAQAETGESKARRRGLFKVFLGYAPATGKTAAMIEDAYRRALEGTRVLVGYVDERGDNLAAQMLEKFETCPHLRVKGPGLSYEGLDLDSVLKRKPELALVDHLACVNPPGLRHERRYLEVEELLRAGIDVYTTINVYQIESQVDAVSFLTGVTVRDTVPDRLLDEADEIEMVDLPPQELLRRFQAGRVAFPAKVEPWMATFFQPGNLFALRELAMRYVARRSNALMHAYLVDRGLADSGHPSERLLVCIGADASGGRLVRAGRRMADETRSEWTVVYVETPEGQDVLQQEQVTQSLRLADLLGAQTEILTGRTVAEAIHSYIREHHIHKVVVGRSAPSGRLNVFGRALSEQLLRLEPSLSVYVVGEDTLVRRFQKPRFGESLSLWKWLSSLGLVIVPTFLGLILTPFIISRSANLIMLYLLVVVIASTFLGLAPAILTAALSVLAFKYFFVPPLYQFSGFAPEYALTFLGLLLIGVLIGTLVARERALSRSAHRRAEQMTQLYELSRDLAAAADMTVILKATVEHIHRTFRRETVVLLAEQNRLILSAASSEQTLDTSELTAAEWAFQQGRPAGANTGTFSYASFSYFPMMTSHGAVGVIGVWFGDRESLHPEQMRQLSAFVTKAAMAVERGLYAEQASQAEVLRVTEKLQTALLNSISHDLRTPLASITGVLSGLRLEDDLIDAETRRELVETAYGEAERLNRLVGNLLDMTRLEAGTLRLSLQPCDIEDVIGSALNTVATRLEGRPVNVEIQPGLPLVRLDYVLITQVLVNLLENSAKYSPEGAPIGVTARLRQERNEQKYLEVAVEDRGPGIPAEDLERIFEKFYRVKRFENVVGTGLGLAICKGIVEVHEGAIWAENRPDGGGCFTFILPLRTATLEKSHERTVQAVNEE